jgi:hypothetical protein
MSPARPISALLHFQLNKPWLGFAFVHLQQAVRPPGAALTSLASCLPPVAQGIGKPQLFELSLVRKDPKTTRQGNTVLQNSRRPGGHGGAEVAPASQLT